jgi:hypothetical protein
MSSESSGQVTDELIVWPISIPLPHVDYSFRPTNPTLASKPEDARIQRRSRLPYSPYALQVVWVLDVGQMDLFKAFYAGTGESGLDMGAKRFRMELRYPMNSELTEWNCRFVGGYLVDQNHNMSTITAQLQLLEESILGDVSARYGYFQLYDSNEQPLVDSNNQTLFAK